MSNKVSGVPLSRGTVVYLTAPQVRERLGNISEMTLWNWIRHDGMSFPRPVYINRRRFWALSDLEAWEASYFRKNDVA
jgi:hypothetical protein